MEHNINDPHLGQLILILVYEVLNGHQKEVNHHQQLGFYLDKKKKRNKQTINLIFTWLAKKLRKSMESIEKIYYYLGLGIDVE